MAEILEGVHHVDGSNANSYLVRESDGTLTLIDAGMQSNGRKILGYITMKMSRTPSDGNRTRSGGHVNEIHDPHLAHANKPRGFDLGKSVRVGLDRVTDDLPEH